MPSPANPQATIVRVALFVVLGVAVIAMIVELCARMNAKAAHEKVDAMVVAVDEDPPADADAQKAFSPAAVQEAIGRPPDAPGTVDGEVMVEAYSWRGAFKSFRVFVKYIGEPPLLDGVSTADPPVWN